MRLSGLGKATRNLGSRVRIRRNESEWTPSTKIDATKIDPICIGAPDAAKLPLNARRAAYPRTGDPTASCV